MSQTERYGSRDLTYSAWHRAGSTGRYVGIENAQLLAMIDIDAALFVEYCDGKKMPLALLEVARDVGQEYKTATVLRHLAMLANLPAFVVLYRPSEALNPCNREYQDIDRFRVKQLHPVDKRNEPFEILTPAQWCDKLLILRGWRAERLDQQLLWPEDRYSR